MKFKAGTYFSQVAGVVSAMGSDDGAQQARAWIRFIQVDRRPCPFSASRVVWRCVLQGALTQNRCLMKFQWKLDEIGSFRPLGGRSVFFLDRVFVQLAVICFLWHRSLPWCFSISNV